MNVTKITLATGKVVLMQEMKIKYQNLAIKAVSKLAGDNTAQLGNLVSQEIMKHLIVNVDDKPMGYKDLEDLDSVFSFAEYTQLQQVFQKLYGNNEAGELQSESIHIGGA